MRTGTDFTKTISTVNKFCFYSIAQTICLKCSLDFMSCTVLSWRLLVCCGLDEQLLPVNFRSHRLVWSFYYLFDLYILWNVCFR